MKKFLSIILSLLLIFTLTLPAFALTPQDELKAIVATDLHYLPTPAAYTVRYADSELFGNVAPTGKLYDESELIIDQFLREAAVSDAEVVLLAGDLVDVSGHERHLALSAKLRAFEATSGKRVYVVNGNHDCSAYSGFTSGDFKEVYSEFGYDEAILIDPNSGSYVADLNDTYRLIAADTNSDVTYNDGSDESLVDWIEAQARQSIADGKYPVLMQHHSLMEHYGLQGEITGGYILDNTAAVCARLAAAGIRYAFTGHIHMHDIAVTNTPSGEIYDVATGCLTSSPVSYRSVDFTAQSVDIASHKITTIDYDALPAGYPAAQRALMQADFGTYASGALSAGMALQIKNYVNVEMLASLLKIAEGNPLYTVINNVIPTANVYMDAPIHRADADGGICVEDLTDKYGMTLVPLDYENWYDMLGEFLSALIDGDGNIAYDSDLAQNFLAITEAILAEAFNGIDGGLARGLYVKISTATGIRTLPCVFSALNLICGGAGFVPAALSGILRPVLESVTVDAAPADSSASLTPYGAEVPETPANLFERILAFFRKLLNSFLQLFS